MLLRALSRELERNMDLMDATASLLRRERDMLQGDLEQRVAITSLHTDVWDSVVNAGTLDAFEESDVIAAAYHRIQEINELIDLFRREGNPKLYSPLIASRVEGRERDEVIDIIQGQCEDAAPTVHQAYQAVQEMLDRTCPVCGRVFDAPRGVKSHLTQVDDAAHEKHAIDL